MCREPSISRSDDGGSGQISCQCNGSYVLTPREGWQPEALVCLASVGHYEDAGGAEIRSGGIGEEHKDLIARRSTQFYSWSGKSTNKDAPAAIPI